MNFAPVYLVVRFFILIGDFLHHWYIDGSRRLADFFVSSFEKLDQTLAIRITVKYFFQPLYKDFTILGRILGVIFRSGRILIGLVVYLIVAGVFLAVYLVYVLLLPVLIAMTLKSLFGAVSLNL
ncbi:MAG: hypothetical protein WCX12_02805 [Candidatus Paceibacterota bacterium]|jgi:hypothetical protein